VTHIFHNAYPLNFNLSLAAFEPRVAFVRTLIDLAAGSSLVVKPRIIFASSVGTVQNWQLKERVPETKVDIDTAIGTGYSESKRVCELVRPCVHNTVEWFIEQVSHRCLSLLPSLWALESSTCGLDNSVDLGQRVTGIPPTGSRSSLRHASTLHVYPTQETYAALLASIVCADVTYV
jgi:hypothetical protein